MPSNATKQVLKSHSARVLALSCAVGLLSAGAIHAQDTPAQDVDTELRDLLPADIKEAGTIVASGAFDNPPAIFADVNDTSVAKGIAPDLSHAMGEILGVTFEWRNTQWPGQLPGLDAGTFDVVWGQISVTEQRERELIDLVPWYQSGIGFLVEEGNPSEVSDWESLCGQIVGVSLGSIFVDVVKNASAKYCADSAAIRINEYQGNEEPALRSGQVNAVMDTYTVLTQMADAIPGVEAVELPQEQSFEFFPGLAGIGVSKEDPGLSKALAGALRSLHENGTWQAIAERYDAGADVPPLDLVKVNALTDTPVGEMAN
ncbi:transporter substrate-binding domain-containing protein [Psychromarinibacter sp. C21-152]|uniref:Transporter substrate-binding domain-containing protein n=1 Tax=Psychromarinibacter sediminicola TaxID=3033385 RepID=A0AAE3NU78_9RHOB|nr:transporter substrate-binding domain-containing protein [Psychromarinibacter sediminicola]MDF0602449.1 transporter substrate-binding domain-containing protein [Psychromarinibacter sediminicola]